MPERESLSKLIVISGPSGAGKDTVKNQIQQLHPASGTIVTYTDRPPRENETEGVDYHFVTKEQFDLMVDDGLFAEMAVTGDSRKGTTKQSLLESSGLTFWRINMSRSGTLADLPEGSLLSPDEALKIRKKTSVVLIGTRSLFTQKDRALKRDGGSMTPAEYSKRLQDDWAIWQEHKDRFQTNGLHPSGVQYFVVYNENPTGDQPVEETIEAVANEIIDKIGL